ncbi:MAG TPA: WD40 repeat domain-containing protein, partial [Phycicoccus sp.]|nr:WD40 repeat domain-containing protein [Phycicoccus sp.]
AGYHSTGGVQGAIARTAEAVFDDLGPEDRALLKQLMTRLVTTGDEGLPTRRRISRSGVDSDPRRHALVERLLAARLVSSDGATVEIAHEALTQAWPRLRSWLDEDVEGLQLMRHLAVAAETWDQAGRPESELYRGQRETRAAQWRATAEPDLTSVERDFLDTSAALAEREREAAAEQVRRERIANRRLRIGITVVVVLALVATTAGAVAATSARRATEAAVVADARRLGSEALRAKDLDTSLLYAVAAMRLDDSIDTRADLLAAIGKHPSLVTVARTPRLTSLAVANGSGLVLAQSAQKALFVLDPVTLRTVREVPEAAGPVAVPAPDGSFTVASIDIDRARSSRLPVVLLDRTGQRQSRQLGGVPASSYVFQDVSVSPDSRHVAILFHRDGDRPRVVGVWDVRTPERPVLLLEDAPGESPVVDATGRRMFLVGDEGLLVLDVPSGHRRAVLTPEDLRVQRIDPVLALSPDGRVLAVSTGAQVLLLDASTFAQRAAIELPGGVDRLQFSPSGERLAVSGETTLVFDVSGDGDPVDVFAQDRAGEWPSFSQDERTLYTSDFDGSVRAWDLAGGRGFLSVSPPKDGPHWGDWGGRVSADGRWALDCLDAPGMVVRSVAGGAASGFVDVEMDKHGSLDCAISADGSLVTMTTSDPRVAVWDNGGGLVASRDLPDGEAAAFSWFTEDGGLVVGTTTGRVHVLDARTLADRRPPIAVPGGSGIYGFALRPRSHDLLAGDHLETLVDLEKGTSRPSGLGIEGFGAAYSPDGMRLAVTTREGSVGLWDVEGNRWLASPSDAQPFAAVTPAFSPDGGEFALAAGDRVGRWDGRTGAFLGATTVGEGTTPGYSPDGTKLLLAGQSGNVYTWDLDPASWIAAACRMAGRDLTAKEWAGQLPDRERRPVCPQASAGQPLAGPGATLAPTERSATGRMGLVE